MTDFIAALEEQLVAAHRDPPPRRFAVPWRGGAILVAAVVTAAAVVAVVLALATPDARKAASPKPHGAVTLPAPEPRYDATVAVLNGTTVAGLGRAAMAQLTSLGFREGVVANDTTNQNRRRTEIYYEPGYREQAQAVAACLEVSVTRARPMNANARVAGDRAEIVVFIGTDKAK
jgi:LytR cell envelope-related transcriptional attenuator